MLKGPIKPCDLLLASRFQEVKKLRL